MKFKNIALCLSAALILTACSDKEEKKEIQAPTNAGKIEITQSENTYEDKVEEVANKDDRSYYYSYNDKKAQNDKTYTPVDANVRVRSPYEKVEISMLVGSLSKKFIVKCSACHNDYANGVIGPSLLDKDEAFIYDSINAFKTGTKTNVLMTELVKQMEEKELRELAKEIATFNQKIKELKAK